MIDHYPERIPCASVVAMSDTATRIQSMSSKKTHFVPHNELMRDAARDRSAVYDLCANPYRGFQLGFAMADAAIKRQGHPLASQIGRCIRGMS